MGERTRKLTATAFMVAVAAVFLYIASLVPSGRVALAAAAGLCTAACVIECGRGWGTACWICASILGLAVAPNKGGSIIFGVFFGIYPVLKSIFERIRPGLLEWILKLLVFNASMSLCLLLYSIGFLAEDFLEEWALWSVYLAGNAVFVIYDIGFTKLIAFYINRISPKRNRK